MLRLALIGRHDVHERYRRIASRIRKVQITAVADSDVAEAGWSVSSPGAEVRASGLDELLSRYSETFDAILFHAYEQVSERDLALAAQAGKHIFCDRPLPPVRGVVRRIVDACRDAGVRLMAGPTWRFSPALRTVKENLDTGRLGAPGLLRIHQWKSRGADSRPTSTTIDEPRWQSLLIELAGGIDVACWLFGRSPSLIYAVSTNRTSVQHDASHRPVDYIQVHLGFAEGGMALIDLARTLPAGAPYYSLSLIGSTGAAYADDHHNMQLHYGGGTPAALATDAREVETAARLQEFVDAIEERREPSVSANEILQAYEIAEIAINAASTGRAVSMTEDA
jgi:myo-inositol 2-dehydrogenase/D-chiro-inositol 1-dehydrogenase